MNPDDLFMGWAFMVVIGPVFALAQVILALPSFVLSYKDHKRAGFVAWVISMAAILVYFAYGMYVNAQDRMAETTFLLERAYFIITFGLAPQGLAYLWSRKRPAMRPIIAGGLTLGAAILFMILGALLGATPD